VTESYEGILRDNRASGAKTFTLLSARLKKPQKCATIAVVTGTTNLFKIRQNSSTIWTFDTVLITNLLENDASAKNVYQINK